MNIVTITKQLMYIRENAKTLQQYSDNLPDTNDRTIAYEKVMLIIDEVNEIFRQLEGEADQ